MERIGVQQSSEEDFHPSQRETLFHVFHLPSFSGEHRLTGYTEESDATTGLYA